MYKKKPLTSFRTGVKLLKDIIKIIKAGIKTAEVLNILNYYV